MSTCMHLSTKIAHYISFFANCMEGADSGTVKFAKGLGT